MASLGEGGGGLLALAPMETPVASLGEGGGGLLALVPMETPVASLGEGGGGLLALVPMETPVVNSAACGSQDKHQTNIAIEFIYPGST